MLEKRCQLACKAETVEGTAETLAGTDAVPVMNPKFNPNTDMTKRPNVSSSLSQWAAVPGARSATMEFDVELKGSGTAGTAPALGKLLKACGFAETIVAITSVIYKPASSGISSMTLAVYNDGIIQKIWGARGTVSLKMEKGKPSLLHFVFTGADYAVTDGVMLTTGVSYEATVPVPFMGSSLTIDSYAALLGSVAVSNNNVIALRDDAGAAGNSSGHKSAVITDRSMVMSIDPEMVAVAAYDWYGKLKSGNEGAFTTSLTGQAGNICTITAPKVQYTAIKPAGKSGILSLGIDCQLNRNAGDDELVIAFT